MSLLRTSWVALAVFGSACGAVKDNESGDDGPAVEDDTTPPSLISSSVMNNATKISVTSTIQFVFDEDLDAATVDNSIVNLTSFRLQEGPSVALNGTATWTAGTKTLEIKFARPLLYDTVYELALPSTIKDLAGNPFGGTTLTFSTKANATTKYVSGSNSGTTTYSYRTYTLDADGRVAREVYFSSAGTDGVWFNSDDNVGSVVQYIYENGQVVQQRYLGAGPDGRLNSFDDVISSMYTYTYDHRLQTAMTYYNAAGIDGTVGTADDGAGADKQWGTADDQPYNYYAYVWEGRQLLRQLYFSARGADNAWHTADDRVGSYVVYSYDAAGHRSRQAYWSAGSDYLAMTSDDTMSDYQDYTYDSNGALATSTYNWSGNDHMPGTADDEGYELHTYTNDAQGNVMIDQYAYDWGADKQWATADDVPYSQQEYAYNDVGQQTRQGSRYLGADHVAGTADDQIGSHTDTQYNASGNRLDQRYFNGAGPDGVWQTADDLYSGKYEYNAD